MLRLNRRLARLEDLLTSRQLPEDPSQWRIEDFYTWKASLSPEELAAYQERADRRLAEWHRETFGEGGEDAGIKTTP